MIARRGSKTFWRGMALAGMLLAAVGVGADYVDVATHFYFSFLSDDFEYFGWALVLVIFLSYVGCIWWAVFLGRQGCAKLAALVFLLPWCALLLGYPIAGVNVHGPAAIVILSMLPATVLSAVLLMLAAVKPKAHALLSL